MYQSQNLGSSKYGAHHWWHQRLTAIILVFFVIWFAYFIKCAFGKNLEEFVIIIQKPYNVAGLIILVSTTFYHAMLGIRVIIEDYISCTCIRNALIISMQIFCFISVVTFIVALIYVMLM